MTVMFGEVTLRASLGATLAVLGALGAIAAGSHVANASNADDTFTVVQTQVSAGNPYQVLFETDSPTTPGLDGLSVAFMKGAVDAYDQQLRALPSHTDPNNPSMTVGMWVADIPAGASGLPLGTYSMTLNGTFGDGGTDSVATGVTAPFLASSAVTLSAAPTSLSYPNIATKLSGQVTLTNPDGTSDTDFPAGLEVSIQSGGSAIGEAPVESDGTFSYSITPSASESVDAQVIGDATVEPSPSSPAVPLTVTSATPTLKLKVNPVTETYGKAAAVSGTLTYGSASAAVAGQHVWVSTTNSSSGVLASGTTAANGSFSITLPERAVGGTLYVGSASANDLTAVTVPLTLKVVHPTTISSFKTTLNQYWGLSVSGCLGFPAGDKTERIVHTSGLTVEYASPGGSWKKLGVINGNESDHVCGTGGIEFSGSFTAPENYAYYRVVYAGTTGATSYAATTGNSVLAWRYDDRITDYKVSPTTVNAGGKLTIKGTLQYYYSGWHNYGGQTIVIYLHPKGSNPTWYWLVKVKTNAKGQFSTTFKDPVSATWQAVFEGNNSNGVGHLSNGSPEVYVRLK
jgi:hypothetical protein